MRNIKIEQIFSKAINREIEAHEFYKEVAARTNNEDVRSVFKQLSEEEMGHMRLLEELKNNPEKIMKIAAPTVDYHIAEATELPALSIHMKPADAIALAMKKEQEAVEFYRGLSRSSDDPEIKKIFDNLVNMELGHKHRLEDVFVEIGYPEVF